MTDVKIGNEVGEKSSCDGCSVENLGQFQYWCGGNMNSTSFLVISYISNYHHCHENFNIFMCRGDCLKRHQKYCFKFNQA